MIIGLIRGTIGTWGSAILDFYVSNGLWINGFILLYALLVVLARRAFDLGWQSLVTSLQSQQGRQFVGKNWKSMIKAMESSNLPWDRVLGRNWFPFMTPPGSIWIYPKNRETFQKLLTPERLALLLPKR